MKRRWSYRVGLFLLMLGIFTGCEGLPEMPDTPEQGMVQGGYAGEEAPEGEGGLDGKEGSDGSESPDGKEGSDGSESPDGKEDTDGRESPDGKADTDGEEGPNRKDDPEESDEGVQEDGAYTSKEEVAAYLHEYGHLPDNFITKEDARGLGWVSSEGNLHEVAPGKSIGGDYFGNYEEILPKQSGRKYYECDIDTDGSYRGAKRIVYSSDGLIYYTEDHYTTFELLYTKDGPAEE